MRIKFEKEILDIKTRKDLIAEIEGQENRARKARAFRRYQCYKDRTFEFVIENLLRQFDAQTVIEMRYGIANISLVRKIVDKLARVYSNGAVRTADGENASKNLQELSKKLKLQSEMKKTNRFQKLQKNVALFVKPCPIYKAEGGIDKWTIKLEAMSPFLYDVVEDYYDRTKPLIWILSSYKPELLPSRALDVGVRPGTVSAVTVAGTPGDNKDQKIADTPADQNAGEKKTYVFWSKNYHFTCDEQGEIIPNEDNKENKNPFGVDIIVNFPLDQDGAFWAEGGDDLIDGAVLINSLISHINHVGVTQGYGQFYMTGENLPTGVKVGPNKVIRAEYKKDEQAKPEFGFLNADPKLDSLRGLVEMYIALLLTTNNLSTNGVATQLNGSSDLPSGIALVIDKAESLEDVQDQEQAFADKEADVFTAINAILKVYGGQMDDDLSSLKLPDDFRKTFNVKFQDAQTIMSEKEKLENMKLRQELGLDTAIDLLMKDDPTLTKELAEKKLKEILEQRIKEKMLEVEAMSKAGVEYDDNGDVQTKTDETAKPGEELPAPAPNGPEDKAPTAGSTAQPTPEGGDVNVQQLSLNGAQVAAMIDIVVKVAAGDMPRDSAVQIIATSFNISLPDAEKILGQAGGAFKVEKPEPPPAPGFGQPKPKVEPKPKEE